MSLVQSGSLTCKTIMASEINFADEYLDNSYGILKGPLSITQQKLSPSGSNVTSESGEVNFIAFAPSRASTALSKNVMIEYTLTATITGPAVIDGTASTETAGKSLVGLLANRLACVDRPLSHCISNMVVDFDGNSYSVNLSEWYQYARYLWNNFEDDSRLWDGMTPVLPDNRPFFTTTGVGNVLGGYTNNPYDTITSRGAFQITSIKATTSKLAGGGLSAQPRSLTVEYRIKECLPISPFSTTNTPMSDYGFIGFSNLKVKISFLNNLFNRCIKLNTFAADGSVMYKVKPAPVTAADVDADKIVVDAPTFARLANTSDIGNMDPSVLTCSCVLSNFNMLLTYNQVSPTQSIPPSLNYNYTNISYFTQDYDSTLPAASTTSGVFQPGELTNIMTNNFQLSGVPNKLLCAVVPKDNNGDIVIGTNTIKGYEYARFFFPITNVSIIFGNTSGICASLQPEQLYLRSIKNGLRAIPFTNSGVGKGFIPSVASNTTPLFEIPLGYPLILSYMHDIYTADMTTSAGVAQNTNFQMSLTCQNYLPNPMKFKIIMMFLYEGLLNLSQSSVSWNYLFVTRDDVISSDFNDIIDINSLPNPVQMAGGSLWKSLKKYGNKTLKFVNSKKFRDVLGKVLDVGADLDVPLISTAAAIAEKGLQAVDAIEGKGMVGGRLLNSKQGGAYVAGGAQTLSAAALRKRFIH